jgi:hypothetical protein
LQEGRQGQLPPPPQKNEYNDYHDTRGLTGGATTKHEHTTTEKHCGLADMGSQWVGMVWVGWVKSKAGEITHFSCSSVGSLSKRSFWTKSLVTRISPDAMFSASMNEREAA